MRLMEASSIVQTLEALSPALARPARSCTTEAQVVLQIDVSWTAWKRLVWPWQHRGAHSRMPSVS